MQFKEADTGAPITAEMIRELVARLGESPETDMQFGAEFVVRADSSFQPVSILEQVATQIGV